jgi:hypothetical protein
MTDLLWISMAVIALVAGILVRRGERGRRGLSDSMIRQIEATGRIDREDVDPLDVDHARAEEDEFWAQDWDEPESLGDPQSWT